MTFTRSDLLSVDERALYDFVLGYGRQLCTKDGVSPDDPEQMKKRVGPLLSNIRLPCIEPEYIAKSIQPLNLFSAHALLEAYNFSALRNVRGNHDFSGPQFRFRRSHTVR